MGVRKRCDGTLIKGLPGFRKINPFVMKGRNESAVYYSDEFVLDETLEFIREYNRNRKPGQKSISIFHVVLCAAVRTIALRPQANRFISGQKIYQRNRIQISFVVKKELTEEGLESTAKITFSPNETLQTIVDKVHRGVKAARDAAGTATDKEMEFVTKLPRFLLNLVIKGFKILDYYGIAPKSMIETDPLYTSVFLANLSSLGLDAPFHHLYEWGNASVFFVMGRIKKVPYIDEQGQVKVHTVMEAKFTIDDRISEGIYWAKTIGMLKHFVEHPQELVEPPEIPEEILKEHMLEEV
ncbi:hypothetical protein Spith_1840 [Spirochaeta thermophila DSM 6578]|uniref:2-oxoacid dehydrogenase acyltransferase catalytic domain-containing protein n=1 Tax=Winmispira thermophila (strain ATCC 700085 / DSM 6578 / Z-1203) TaxID=869211 RepID=G0GD24_WINT7|nr:2-oxo acid dehydrogenase subunit E2 [Spirochaeta thermophila]AEJ62099.1 hypothetical protein Spith_1840 [Spirochaeta thermophila DSM 6578]